MWGPVVFLSLHGAAPTASSSLESQLTTHPRTCFRPGQRFLYARAKM